jgi:hypothetical protein
MTASRRRLTALSLSCVLLLAQLLLAWHIPTHLHDHSDVPVAELHGSEPCALGINGHGVAIVAAPMLQDCQPAGVLRSADITAPTRHTSHTPYQARAPPLHS